MSTKRQYVKIAVGVFLALSMMLVCPMFGEDTPQSAIGQSQLPKAKKPVANNWLPDIVGIPNEEQVESLTQHVADVMAEEQDPKCNKIDHNLKMLVFQNFVIYQHMANAQHIYFDEELVKKYAHILAMILKESSGDPTNITDMSGRSVSTSEADTNLHHWESLPQLTTQKGIKLNTQTNFGLTQLSVDRLFVAFKLAHGSNHNKDFLEGKYGDASPQIIPLDTAIAIRRMIWFYQGFAQGRLTQDDDPIAQGDISKPEFNERYHTGLKMALLYCGTRFFFNKDKHHVWVNEYPTFEKTMASIAYCKLGNVHAGYGKTRINGLCFAEWVTLCPALNMDIALMTPLSYFQTRNNKPVCIGTLNRLLNKKPQNK